MVESALRRPEFGDRPKRRLFFSDVCRVSGIYVFRHILTLIVWQNIPV